MNAITPKIAPQTAQDAQTPAPLPVDTAVTDLGLKAQARLFPYALGFFGIGLPLFLWTAKVSVSPWLLAFYMLLFIAGWTGFMILRSQSDKRIATTSDAINVHARLLRHSFGGALWVAILLMICLSAGATGRHAEILLMICAGAAVGIIFFCTPVLIELLILGPLAVAGPIIAFRLLDASSELGHFMTGGLALALAIGVILNRHMREHYLLQHRQDELTREREAAHLASALQNRARVALMETLSREVQTGLKGVEQNLLQGLALLTRAPAPRAHVDAALSEVGHLQAILTTTFDNDTAEAGQIELAVAPLDVERIAGRLMAQFADLARSKGLAFSMSVEGLPSHGADAGAAIGDEHRVEQILSHLLSNALLYTQQGRVEVRFIHVDGFLRIKVLDSGPGLSDTELHQAFTPHSRIARTSSGHSGAGLGLSLSRSLAGLMGGRVGAESTPDVGSKFWLDLPWDATATPPPRPPEDAPATDANADNGLRVLLLSNDSLRSAQLRDTLEHMGHKCLTSTSRERALSLAHKAPIDACVISTGAFDDLAEPSGRDSLEAFLAGLRATQASAVLNIVALLPTGDQAEDLQALGVRPLLLPQSRESLARALAQA